MKNYTNVKDLGNLQDAIQEALEIKKNRYAYKHIGENKTLLMVFFNSSLRTRLSTQKAGMNLGMILEVILNDNCCDISELIDKFKLEDENENDLTDQILHLPKVVIFFSYAPEKIKENDKNFLEYGIEDFIFNYKELNPKSEFYGASTQKSFFKKVKSLTMDGTAIKTIARSNPFVLVLENGKIIEKKSLEDFLKH